MQSNPTKYDISLCFSPSFFISCEQLATAFDALCKYSWHRSNTVVYTLVYSYRIYMPVDASIDYNLVSILFVTLFLV